MITKILWMVIYLAVGYLIAIATEEEEDTPGMMAATTALWPLLASAWIGLNGLAYVAAVTDWLLIKMGYEEE